MNGKNIIKILISSILLAAIAFNANAQGGFISGLDGGFTFTPAKCGSAGMSFNMTTSGKTFRIITFYYNNSTVTAAEEQSGKRSILFIDGKPTLTSYSSTTSPKIGFSAGKELKDNEYMIASHDFTDDGQPELVIGVASASGDGMGVYIFEFDNAWKCIGEMVTSKHNVRSCRIFRQTITIKDADTGVLYTWTWHNGHFYFLSSDQKNDPSVLY